jgi:hypothetical protein
MTRDAVRLRPPNHSYVDMLEHLSDGLHVDVVVREGHARQGSEQNRASPTERENSRPSSRSSHDGQD